MITIRLAGTPAEVEAAAAKIYEAFYVIKETDDYKNRQPSDLVRRYLEVELIQDDQADKANVNRNDQRN